MVSPTCMCRTARAIIKAVRASKSLSERGNFDCDAHFKTSRNARGEATGGTETCVKHSGLWASSLTSARPPFLSLQLNVSGRAASAKKAPKAYTITGVPLTIEPTAVGFAPLDREAFTYVLFSVWCHTAGLTFESGHWIAFVRTSEDTWWKVDMETVKQVTFDSIPLRYAHFAFERLAILLIGTMHCKTVFTVLPGMHQALQQRPRCTTS